MLRMRGESLGRPPIRDGSGWGDSCLLRSRGVLGGGCWTSRYSRELEVTQPVLGARGSWKGLTPPPESAKQGEREAEKHFAVASTACPGRHLQHKNLINAPATADLGPGYTQNPIPPPSLNTNAVVSQVIYLPCSSQAGKVLKLRQGLERENHRCLQAVCINYIL